MGVTDPLSPHVGKRRWHAGSVPEAMFPRAGAGSAAGKVPASPVPGNGRLGLSREWDRALRAGEPLLPRRRRQADNGTGTGSREVIPESGDGDWGPREWGRAQLRDGGEAVPASGAGCGERWGRSHRGCGTERAGPTGDVKSLRTCPGHRVGKEGE